MTLFDQFKANRDNRPDSAAFLIAAGDRSVPITWREFAHDIEAIAWLAKRFAPGATVGLLGENSYEWMTAHAAGLFAGITVVPLEMNLTPPEIAERLAFTGASVLVHSALYAEKAREVGRLVPGLMVGGFGSRKSDELMDMARTALEMGDAGIFDTPQRDENETATLVFTSGTTSRPRGAELTLGGIRTFSDFAASTLGLEPDGRSLMLLPLHHIFGICTTYAMLAHGVALGVCPDFRRIFDAVERFRANYLFLVPALAEILAAKIEQHGRSAEEALGTPIDGILVGGAPLARRTYERLIALGISTIGGYGLTETTSLYSLAPPSDPRPGSAGKSCNGFGGMETKVDGDGVLLIKGPAVLKGYYKEPERTAEVLSQDGWFKTGDIGRIDADGYVWITGRASRTIVLSSGKKVAPEELEERILSIPGIHEVVVSGDGSSRELRAEIYAVVSEATLRRQIDSLNRQLPVHKRINVVVARKEPFPRTASGKIRIESARPGVEVVPASAAVPSVAPEPARRGFWRHRRRPAALLVKAVAVALAVVAFLVLTMSLAQRVIERHGLNLPGVARFVLDFSEETGELLLALLVLPAVFMLLRAIERRRGGGE